MLFLFVPYYNEPTKEFLESIENSTIKFGGDTHANRMISMNRKSNGIYWTKAVNNFYKFIKSCRGVKDDDVVAIMNSDISFSPDLLAEGMKVKLGEVYMPEGINIIWRLKLFFAVNHIETGVKTFAGRCFFMAYGDFIKMGKFCKWLPHYLSDYDYGLKALKTLKPVIMGNKIIHDDHPKVTKPFKMISNTNPIFWTVFLLRHPNLYTPLNILKAWFDAWRLR